MFEEDPDHLDGGRGVGCVHSSWGAEGSGGEVGTAGTDDDGGAEGGAAERAAPMRGGESERQRHTDRHARTLTVAEATGPAAWPAHPYTPFISDGCGAWGMDGRVRGGMAPGGRGWGNVGVGVMSHVSHQRSHTYSDGCNPLQHGLFDCVAVGGAEVGAERV